MPFLQSPAPIAIVALLFFLGFRKSGGPSAWETRIDLPLALTAGIVMGVVSDFWMARYYLRLHTLTASDFGQYCLSVEAWRSDQMRSWVLQRSIGAGFLSGFFSGPFGILDGLAASALVASILMNAGFFLWARALHSRLAGVAAAMLGGSVAPLVVLSRTVTFYPVIVAGFVLSAAGAALAMRFRTVPSLVAAGFGAGIALLVDVRGLLWALPALGLGCLAAVLRGPGELAGESFWTCHFSSWGRMPGRFLVLFAPVIVSFGLGQLAYPKGAASLERQVVIYIEDALERSHFPKEGPGFSSVNSRSGNFVWGHSSPLDIPGTLAFLADARAALPAQVGEHPEVRVMRNQHVAPWEEVAFAALLVGALALVRRPLLIVAYLGTVLPFYAALQSALSSLPFPRFLANGMGALPVILALGLAGLAQGVLPADDGTGRPKVAQKKSILTVIFLLMLGLTVLGVIPSWLSPAAPWRVPITADEEPAKTLSWVGSMPRPDAAVDVTCLSAIGADVSRGHALGSAWFPETYVRDKGAEIQHTPTPVKVGVPARGPE